MRTHTIVGTAIMLLMATVLQGQEDANPVTGKFVSVTTKTATKRTAQSAPGDLVIQYSYKLTTKLKRIKQPALNLQVFYESSDTERHLASVLYGANVRSNSKELDASQLLSKTGEILTGIHLDERDNMGKRTGKKSKVIDFILELWQGGKLLEVYCLKKEADLIKANVSDHWLKRRAEAFAKTGRPLH